MIKLLGIDAITHDGTESGTYGESTITPVELEITIMWLDGRFET